jgi:NAD+ synthase (glutamine-hydrolysing)
MNELGKRSKEIDIRNDCYQLMVSDGYKPFGIDLVQLQHDVEAANAGKSMDELKALVLDAFHEKLVNLPDKSTDLGFENYQARVRTLKLMQHGFVLGTGDLSELAKGWCTYNGDQMSMYNINAGVPKTLVKWVVNYLAHHEFEGEVRETLSDIVGTAISPELLPTGKDGESKQKTEDAVGPYELTDFYLYYLLRYGFTPEKILYLATQAKFDIEYSEGDHRRWLCDFVERFFRQQFKRSASPDGLKIGTISFSPRGDWRMPSDACSALWLSWLDAEERATRIKATARPAVPAAAVPAATVKGETK